MEGESNGVNDKDTTSLPFTVGQEFTISPSSFPNSEIVFFYEASIDTSDFNQGEAAIVPVLDHRRLSQFSPTNRGLNADMLRKDYLEKLLRLSDDPEIQAYIRQLMENHQLKPVNAHRIGKTAYHGGAVLYFSPLRAVLNNPEDKVDKMRKKGVYGRSNGLTYFSTDLEAALVHAKSSENSPAKHGIGDPKTRFLLLTIDVEKLAQKRNIFIDPESLAMPSEFMKNFVVHQGIPVSAIARLDLMQFRGIRQRQS